MNVTGAELIARSLIANGITHVFNVPGLGIHPLIDAIKRHRDQLAYFTAPSETGVSLMADGYGRATGRPAFVNVYHASGTALAMMGITTAWGDHSPMLFTTTTSGRRLERRDQYASVPGDITAMSREFVKWSWEVPLVERIPEAIARAVLIASTPPYGPVHLAFPMDLYTDEIAEETAAGALLARPDRLRVYTAGGADPAGVIEAARLLDSAVSPLLVVGGDTAQYDAVGEIVAIAELLECPVLSEPYVAYMGFPNTHALFAGRYSASNPLVKEADVVVFVGAELTEGGGGAGVLPPTAAKAIVLATSVLEMGKQIWADVGLVGHPKTTLVNLLAALKTTKRAPQDPAWRLSADAARAAYRAHLVAETARGWDVSPISLPRLFKEAEKVFGDQAIIVDHSTTGTAHLLQLYGFEDPRRYFGISARASAQGWGVPAAIGVQIARPDRQVVVFAGDGGFMFTSSALYAAALWKLRLVVIVLSNGGWHDVAYGAQKRRAWTDQDLRDFGWVNQPPIDYAGFARSVGIASENVSEPAGLSAALERARDADGPTMVIVRTDPKAVEYYLGWVAR